MSLEHLQKSHVGKSLLELTLIPMASIPSDCQIEKTKIAFDELPKPCQAKDDNDAKISPTFAEKAKPKPMTAGNGKLNNMGAL